MFAAFSRKARPTRRNGVLFPTMARRRRYPLRKAPPKPTEPPCEFCDVAYWRYNGQDWYACDRVTKKRHVCSAPAAIEQRTALEAERQALRDEQAIRQRRQRRTERAVHWAIAAAIAAGVVWWGYASWTRPDQPQRPGVPATPQVEHVSPLSGSNGVQNPPLDTPTAKCADGTLSYAVSHQGACSWHGGVVEWYR